jgi:flagellar assembly protein FliH
MLPQTQPPLEVETTFLPIQGDPSCELVTEAGNPDLESLLTHARDEGFCAGQTAMKEDLQANFSALAAAIASVEQARRKMLREAEADEVTIAIAVARKILRREVHVDPDALRDLVAGALSRLRGEKVLQVHIDPVLKPGMLRALAATQGGDEIEVVVEANAPTGTILFSTSRGILDASLDSQLKEIETGLADRLERA